MIKVAIADGHRLVRTGLTMLINEQKDMTVVGQAKNSVETLEIVNEFTPHVLLVDGQMLEHNCYEVMKKTSEHHDCCHMIIIANDHDPNLMYDVFKYGAVGFLLRSEEHTSELQSRGHLVCRLLLEKKKKTSDTEINKLIT